MGREDRREPKSVTRKDHKQEQDEMPDSIIECQDIMLHYHHASRYKGAYLSSYNHESNISFKNPKDNLSAVFDINAKDDKHPLTLQQTHPHTHVYNAAPFITCLKSILPL